MTAKIGLGLDHNETHSRHGWHRDASFVMLAFGGAVLELQPEISRALRIDTFSAQRSGNTKLSEVADITSESVADIRSK